MQVCACFASTCAQCVCERVYKQQSRAVSSFLRVTAVFSIFEDDFSFSACYCCTHVVFPSASRMERETAEAGVVQVVMCLTSAVQRETISDAAQQYTAVAMDAMPYLHHELRHQI